MLFAKDVMKFFLLVISLVSSTVYSQTHQFQHLKLKGLLKEQNLIGHMVESKSFKQKNNKAVATQKQIYSKIFGAEKVSESLLKAKDEPDSPFENSLLFEKITQMLQGNYEEIGRAQAQTLLNHHQDFGGGVKNFSGFSWEKPAGTFSIGVNRQLSPDLFDSERWIVHDTLVIHIDAATFLNKLKEAQLLDIDTAQLRAYAGIQ